MFALPAFLQDLLEFFLLSQKMCTLESLAVAPLSRGSTSGTELTPAGKEQLIQKLVVRLGPLLPMIVIVTPKSHEAISRSSRSLIQQILLADRPKGVYA